MDNHTIRKETTDRILHAWTKRAPRNCSLLIQVKLIYANERAIVVGQQKIASICVCASMNAGECACWLMIFNADT